MNRKLQHALLFAIATTLSATAFAESKGGAYATVNGKAIPQNRADAMIAGQMAKGQANSEDLQKAVKEELVRREILTQEAQRKGLDKKSDIQAQMELARQGVLIGAYLNDWLHANPVTDEQAKKEYDGIKAQTGDKEYKVRHILVEKEDEAKAIIDKLKKGEKFEELAKASKDPGSKEKGGDLGWANRSAYVKPFSEAMVKLEKGKTTETPVKSDFGYHVIQLEDTRELKFPTFEEAKAQIVQRMQQIKVQAHVNALRAKAKVE